MSLAPGSNGQPGPRPGLEEIRARILDVFTAAEKFPAITFRAFVKEHFEPTVLPTLRPSTQDVYRRYYNTHLLPAFGDLQLHELRSQQIQSFLLAKLQTGLAPQSVLKLKNVLSKILETAITWEYLFDNPCRRVKLPPAEAKRPPLFLTAEQVRQLFRALPQPTRTMALLAAMTGLRFAEIAGLRWGAVDLAAGELRVQETYWNGHFSPPKTKTSRRTVPLSPAVVRALQQHARRSKNKAPHDLVFTNRNGRPVNRDNLRKRALKNAAEKLKLPRLGWHTLRHTHATLLHAAGVPLRVIQQQLGHSRATITLEIYSHALQGSQREAVQTLEKVLRPK